MKVSITKERFPGERRVAASPKTVTKLLKLGFECSIESGAGEGSSYTDALYEAAGATVTDRKAVLDGADIVVNVRPPAMAEAAELPEGVTLISFLWPAQNKALVDALAARKITALAMDCVPRISRAQRLDALSSMANIAGYRAVVEAANHFGSFFTGQFTAAGKVAPATVLVIGAGVAGLAAIGAAKALGAVVRAFDTREAVADQVKSLGGEFLFLELEESGEGGGGYAKVMSKEFISAEMALFLKQAPEVDIVITTALIPGKKAPNLWPAEHVAAMKPGSVVVDLAAEQGGNCELTEPGQVVVKHGVTLVGHTDMPSRMGAVASDLYGANVANLLDELGGAERYVLDHDNEITRGTLVLENGELLWPPPKKDPPPAMPAAKPAAKPAMPEAKAEPTAAKPSQWGPIMAVATLAFVGVWLGLRYGVSTETVDAEVGLFLQRLTVFVLACFVGWQVVWSVTAALHTPLMSVTNAISGIIIVGGVLELHGDSLPVIVGAAATFFAMINVVGGFYVTKRMLAMFRR